MLHEHRRSGDTPHADHHGGAGRQPQQRQNLAVQRHLGRSRARRQLQRRDRRRQDRQLRLPRLPLRGHRPARHLRSLGLYARGALRASSSGCEHSRCGDKLRGRLESGTQSLPDHRTDRHKPAYGRGAQHVRRVASQRSHPRLREIWAARSVCRWCPSRRATTAASTPCWTP